MNSPSPSMFQDDVAPNETVPNDNASDSDISIDSLFDQPSSINSTIPHQKVTSYLTISPARRCFSLNPEKQVQGLFYDPSISISPDLEIRVIDECLKTWFTRPMQQTFSAHSQATKDNVVFSLDGLCTEKNWEFNDVNQVMLFNRTDGITDSRRLTASSWPACLTDLLTDISQLLKPPIVETQIWNLLFSPTDPNSASNCTESGQPVPTRSRQAIINLYHPGEGISDHIDLLDRYGDGIIGVSFGTGCVMRFRDVDEHDSKTSDPIQLYLPPRSIIVLSGEARYKWTHGIQATVADFVQPENMIVEKEVNTMKTTSALENEDRGVWIERGMRLSVTFRWLKIGADIVGTEHLEV